MRKRFAGVQKASEDLRAVTEVQPGLEGEVQGLQAHMKHLRMAGRQSEKKLFAQVFSQKAG